MKQEEKKFLIESKVSSGKEIEQALEEIKRLETSQIEFKNYKKELITLKNIMLRLKKERDDLANKNFKLNLKLHSQHEVKRETLKENGNQTIRHMSRILLILRDSKEPVAQGVLSKNCLVNNGDLYPCLGFLEKEKLIKSIKDGGVIRYYISENGN